ncbi:hypothetical protein PQX77_006734 [Marasmius sp. AFHP31]|nr:hypothetical protein PQX77_006734 [Marasmius sp. AFHP31]
MHPFGGSPLCPRCSKAVYAAEQVMGPGRKLYHKVSVFFPCLACTSCNKRLDSYTLLEYDQQPYCKACHVKNFGTRDLRQANLPQAPRRSSSTSPPPSPAIRSPTKITFSLQPNRSLSPTKQLTDDLETDEARDTVQDDLPSPNPRTMSFESPASTPSLVNPTTPTRVPVTLGRSNSAIPASMVNAMTKPLTQTATGTRYGAALGNVGVATNMTGSSPRKWGGTTPSCPKCGKSVYFAEQTTKIPRSVDDATTSFMDPLGTGMLCSGRLAARDPLASILMDTTAA